MTEMTPEWFLLAEELTTQIMSRIAEAVSVNQMQIQVRNAAQLAHWFMLDSLLLANKANREGMHANALSATRQCIEALGIIELGICRHSEADSILLKWDKDELSPGKLRGWLEQNIWPQYGLGLWNESWATFMHEFVAALQPYAHYSSKLAQWQLRILPSSIANSSEPNTYTRYIEIRPRAYDAQKATRITLFHTILSYVLGRIWIAHNIDDEEFTKKINALGSALSKSPYLDGHETNWSQQFWAMLWGSDGSTLLE